VKNEILINSKLTSDDTSKDIQRIHKSSRNNLTTILEFIKVPESPIEGEYATSPQTFYLLRAIYLFYIREFNVVERNVALSLKENPNELSAIFLYGLSKLYNSDFNSALKMLNIYSKYDSDLWIISYLKSYLYYKLGDEKNMEEYWEKTPNSEFILKDFVKKEEYFENISINEDIFGITYDFLKKKMNLD
jgi:hypothetical protein